MENKLSQQELFIGKQAFEGCSVFFLTKKGNAILRKDGSFQGHTCFPYRTENENVETTAPLVFVFIF
jgi:hypothetical protein